MITVMIALPLEVKRRRRDGWRKGQHREGSGGVFLAERRGAQLRSRCAFACGVSLAGGVVQAGSSLYLLLSSRSSLSLFFTDRERLQHCPVF